MSERRWRWERQGVYLWRAFWFRPDPGGFRANCDEEPGDWVPSSIFAEDMLRISGFGPIYLKVYAEGCDCCETPRVKLGEVHSNYNKHGHVEPPMRTQLAEGMPEYLAELERLTAERKAKAAGRTTPA